MFDFDFSPASLIVGFLVSSIGFVSFSYGRKMDRGPQQLVGLLLMIFPWFVTNPIAVGVIGAVLCGALWGAVKLGY